MTTPASNTSSLPHRPNIKSFPTTRQPYWRDSRIHVVTETRVVSNMNGGWVVDKKKYLEYPKAGLGIEFKMQGLVMGRIKGGRHTRKVPGFDVEE